MQSTLHFDVWLLKPSRSHKKCTTWLRTRTAAVYSASSRPRGTWWLETSWPWNYRRHVYQVHESAPLGLWASVWAGAKNNTSNFHLYGRLDPRSYTIHTATSDFILIPSEEMPPPHAPTSFLPGKEEQPQNYREKTSHRPTTWTTTQEVSGLTIELLHREKIVKKKTCAGVSDKTKSCAVFSSIHIVHATPAQHSSCFAWHLHAQSTNIASHQ